MALFGGIELPGKPDPENIRKLDLLPLPMIRRMHRLGFAIDVPYLLDLSSRFGREMADLQKDISSYIPPDKLHEFTERAIEAEGGTDGSRDDEGFGGINVNSAEQIGELLFNILGIGKGCELKMTKSGTRLSTDKKQLTQVQLEHPAVPKILAYKERAKLKSTYSDSLPRLARLHPRSVESTLCPVCELHHEHETWRVHTEIVTTRTETGRLASRRPNCFDCETEVLTKRGWVMFPALKKYEKVAQWDAGKITFVLPTSHIRSTTDSFTHIRNQHIDLLVTPDHRCLLRHRKRGGLKVFEAASYPEDWKQIHGGIFVGGDVDGCGFSSGEIRFMIAMQADGSWVRDTRALTFTFKRPRKIKRFRELLAKCGLGHSENPHKSSAGRRFYIPNCPLLERLYLLMGKEKLFSWGVFMRMTQDELQVCAAEIPLWDGSIGKGKEGNSSYATKHKQNADIVATVFSLVGYRSVVRKWRNNADRWYWVVDTTGRDFSLTTNIRKEIIAGSFETYCVSVPSSFLLVRRNGKIMVTGNCQNIPIRSSLGELIRAAFIASPGNVLVSVDFSQIELRMMAHCAVALGMIQVYLNNGDIHEQTCLDCFGLTDVSQIDKIRHRIPAKTANFLTGYGGSAKALLQQLGMAFSLLIAEGKLDCIPAWLDLPWCERFIEKWFAARPEIRDYMDLMAYRTRRYGMVWDSFGRVRMTPEIRSCHSWIKAAALRQAGNMPIQGIAANLMKIVMAMVEEVMLEMMNRMGVWCWPLLPVHDQLIVECGERDGEDLLDMMMVKFDNVMWDEDEGRDLCRVPIRSDGGIMERWRKD